MDRPTGTAVLEPSPLQAHFGIEVVEANARGSVIRLPRPAGASAGPMHATQLFAAAETAATAALDGLLGCDKAGLECVITASSTRFAKPATWPLTGIATIVGDPQAIAARIENEGAAIFFVEVRMADAGGVVVAQMRFEWFVRTARA